MTGNGNDTEDSATPPAVPDDGQSEGDVGGSTRAEPVADQEEQARADRAGQRVSISVRSLVFSLVAAVLVGTIGVLAWLLVDARGQVRADDRRNADYARAEQIALDYAVDAAAIDYRDLDAWKVQLVKGTTPELKDRLTKAGDSMEQILAPLQWSSTARPLAAKVRTEIDGSYIVDSFVSVLTKTLQAPEGLQSTATYSLTIDSRNDWQISDVGGIDAAVKRN